MYENKLKGIDVWNKYNVNWCMKIKKKRIDVWKKNKVIIIIIEKLFLIADLDQNMQKYAYLIEMS